MSEIWTKWLTARNALRVLLVVTGRRLIPRGGGLVEIAAAAVGSQDGFGLGHGGAGDIGGFCCIFCSQSESDAAGRSRMGHLFGGTFVFTGLDQSIGRFLPVLVALK